MEILLKIKNATPGNIKSKLNKALKSFGTDFRIEKCIKIRKSEKGYKLQGRINFQGLNISIENRKGSIRCGVDSDDHIWKTKMNYPYGRIIGVKRLGHDGDHIDCYVGDNRQSNKVYIIHIKNCVTGKYDEDKVMLGFNNQKEVIIAFKTQYDNFSKIFDGIEKMSIHEFKECLKKKTKSIIVKLKDFTRENADYKVTKALAGVGKALNCDFICKSIDTSKCSLEMTTDCNGNIIHRWKRIDDEYLLNQKQLFSNAVKLFIERGYTQGTPITILNKTPEILQEKAAMPNVKITVDPKILRKILTKPKTPKEHNHFMPVNLVNDLPVQLTKPLAILKDIENNHTIIVTEQFYKNRPVIAAIEVAKNIGGNITVNSLRSFHDKRCESFFDFWNKKQVLFEDKEKTKALREFLHVRGFDSLNPSSEISIPKSINKSINHAEKPSYQALQDIIDNSNAEVEKIKLQAYNFICKFLGLPKISGIDINKSFTESEHPRAENGQFTSKDESTYKEEIEQALKENVTPMPENIPFTKENYDKLFKNGINTPIGKVKLGENQFDKLKDKDLGNRQKILKPMYETLKNPALIIKTNDNTKLFCKEFSRQDKKNKLIVSVVIDRDNLQISISTHIERLSQIQKKCRTILYKKNPNGNVGYTHHADVSRNSNISKSINKSINDELTVNGKIIFDPIWGIPLKQKDYVQMIGTLENFLSRRLKETEKRLLLQSSALGHLIALSKNGQTKLLLETVKLKNIVYKGKTFDQLCTDYDTLKKNFDKVTDNEIEKLKFIEDQIGVYVTNAKDVTIKVIKDIYYDAVINHKSKSQIAQEMYDKLGFLNRSWDTIARTESNNLKNHAFLIGSLNENRKTYFRRRVGSYNTCKICASHRNKIALWANSPLPDDKINDEIADIAIWSGKTNIGRDQKDWWIPEGSTHPNCFCEWEKLLDEEIKYFRKSFTESDHPRAENGRFTSKGNNENVGYAARLRNNFNTITNPYLNTAIKNKATGLEAVFSKVSQKELRSRTINTKLNGFTLSEHFEVANRIIDLFENADLIVEHEDFKNKDDYLKIERFLSKEVTLKSGQKVQACITVKHSLNPDGRNIYSIEAIDIKNALEKTRAKGQQLVNTTSLSNESIIPKSIDKSIYNESDHPRAENGQFTSKDESTETSNVNHEGEYVLTKKGSKDFGKITRDIGRQPGKIRLRIGTHDENTDKGEGEVHIERPKRLKQLKMYGFNNARDFVEYTCENFDEVYASGMALLLVKKENGFTCVVRLTPLKDEEFYDVKTVYVMPERTIKNKLAKEEIRLIWQKPNSPNVETFKSEHLKSDNGIPIGFIKGTPDPSNISESINKSINNRGSIHFNALINCTTSLNLSSKPETYCSLHF